MERYRFTIIMIAYNVRDYIDDAIRSVIEQDIGFEHVQLIIVNDGSTDDTLERIKVYSEKYRDNIILIDKVNGGPGSARNAGIPYIEGEFVNFMDSDDMLRKDALRKVYSFFEQHREETDLVSIPLIFFDALTGEHHLNYKYRKGSRVIDLEKEWDAPQLHGASSFIKKSTVEKYRFDERIGYADDCEYVQMSLMEKRTLGVVSDTVYLYRKRSGENLSLIQSSFWNRNWYIPVMRYSYLEIIENYKKKYAYVPRSVQNVICNDLQWKLSLEEIPLGVLSDDEEKEYRGLIKKVLEDIDDDIILYQKNINKDMKMAFLKYKGRDLVLDKEEACLRSGDHVVYSLADDARFSYDFLDIDEDLCTLEGRYYLPINQEMPEVYIDTGEHNHALGMKLFDHEKCIIDDKLTNIYSFKVQFKVHDHQNIVAKIRYGSKTFKLNNIVYGQFMPLSTEFRKMYGIRGRFLIEADRPCLKISTNDPIKRVIREVALLWEFLRYRSEDHDTENSAKKAILVRPLSLVRRIFKKRPIWIFRDRVNIADDNALVLFEYVNQNVKDVDAVFALSAQSRDLDRVSKIGRTIDCLSGKYKLLYLYSDLVISSAADDDVFNPFEGHYEPYKDLLYDTRFIFLQHGVIHNDLSSWLNKYNVNISGFVCTAQREAEALRGKNYAYEPEQIWLTGMPRYDRLKDDAKKIVTFAPTWRNYLLRFRNRNGVYDGVSSFESSDYCKALHDLIFDRELKENADKYGYKLQILMHPSMQVYKDLFKDGYFKLCEDQSYQKMFEESSLFVTDYSSAAFDFAYLKKPVLYYQFDRDHFFNKHLWKEGYFNYEKDSFGEIEYDLEGIVRRMIEYMKNGCKMKEIYRERVDSFFEFHDHKNCDRVLEKIRKE